MTRPPLIHTFGASGSGTTTLGRALADAWGLAYLDSDDSIWLPTDIPYAEMRPRDQRKVHLAAAVSETGGCVLGGSLCGWGDFLIPRFTLAVYLSTPTELRIKRLRSREADEFGDRIGPGGDMQKNHEEFIEWAQRYDTAGPDMRSRALHEEWIQTLTCPVVRLDGSRPLADLLEELEPYRPES